MVATDRLRASADIRRAVAARRAAGGRCVVVHVRDREDADPPRATVVAGRKVGGAVVRNRAKRRLRAVLADLELPDGIDAVVTAKAGADAIPFTELQEDLAQAVRRALRRASEHAVSAR